MQSIISHIELTYQTSLRKKYGSRHEMQIKQTAIYLLRHIFKATNKDLVKLICIDRTRVQDANRIINYKLVNDPEYREFFIALMINLDDAFPDKGIADYKLPRTNKSDVLVEKSHLIKDKCDRQRAILSAIYS